MLVLASAFLAKLSHPVVLAVLMGAAVGGSMCTRARRNFRDPRRLDNNQLFLWRDDGTKWQRISTYGPVSRFMEEPTFPSWFPAVVHGDGFLFIAGGATDEILSPNGLDLGPRGP